MLVYSKKNKTFILQALEFCLERNISIQRKGAKFILLCGWQFKGEFWYIMPLTNTTSGLLKCSDDLFKWDQKIISLYCIVSVNGWTHKQMLVVSLFAGLCLCDLLFNLGKWCVKRSSLAMTVINRLQTVWSHP